MADFGEELLNYELGDDIDYELLPEADEDALLLSDEELEKDLNNINEAKAGVDKTILPPAELQTEDENVQSIHVEQKLDLDLTCCDDALLCDADMDIPGLNDIESNNALQNTNGLTPITTQETQKDAIKESEQANNAVKIPNAIDSKDKITVSEQPLLDNNQNSVGDIKEKSKEPINYLSKIDRSFDKFYVRYNKGVSRAHTQLGGHIRSYGPRMNIPLRYQHKKIPPQRFLTHGPVFPAQNVILPQQTQQLHHLGPSVCPPNAPNLTALPQASHLNPHLQVAPPHQSYYNTPHTNGFYDGRNQMGNAYSNSYMPAAQGSYDGNVQMFPPNANFASRSNSTQAPVWGTEDTANNGVRVSTQTPHSTPASAIPLNGYVESASPCEPQGISQRNAASPNLPCVGKVLINPNFKGGIEAAKNKFFEETQMLPAISNEEKLKRQQEQFINENREFLGKLRYDRSPSPLSSNSGNSPGDNSAAASTRLRSRSVSRSRSRERSYSPKRRGDRRLDRDRDHIRDWPRDRERDRERLRDRERDREWDRDKDRFSTNNRERIRDRQRGRKLQQPRVGDARYRRNDSRERGPQRAGNVGSKIRRRKSLTPPPSTAKTSDQTPDEDDEIRQYRMQIEKQKELREKYLRDKELNRRRTIEKQKLETLAKNNETFQESAANSSNQKVGTRGKMVGKELTQQRKQQLQQRRQKSSRLPTTDVTRSTAGFRGYKSLNQEGRPKPANSPKPEINQGLAPQQKKQRQAAGRGNKIQLKIIEEKGTLNESSKKTAAFPKIDSESKLNIIKYVTSGRNRSSNANAGGGGGGGGVVNVTGRIGKIIHERNPNMVANIKEKQIVKLAQQSATQITEKCDELRLSSIDDDEVELDIDDCELDYDDMDLEYEEELLISPAEEDNDDDVEDDEEEGEYCTTGTQSSMSTPDIAHPIINWRAPHSLQTSNRRVLLKNSATSSSSSTATATTTTTTKPNAANSSNI